MMHGNPNTKCTKISGKGIWILDLQVRFNAIAICAGCTRAQPSEGLEKACIFRLCTERIFLNVNPYIAVPALSGQDYKKGVSRNLFFLFFAEGPEMY